jgi:hypothetical protein
MAAPPNYRVPGRGRIAHVLAGLEAISKQAPASCLAMAVGIAGLFLGIIGYGKAAGYWNGDVPDYVYRRLVPRQTKWVIPE